MSSCRKLSSAGVRGSGARVTLGGLGRHERFPDHEEQAPCAQMAIGEDFDPWFPKSGRDALTPIARRICAGCPFQADCLQIALENDVSYGIWGGLTAAERKRLITSK